MGGGVVLAEELDGFDGGVGEVGVVLLDELDAGLGVVGGAEACGEGLELFVGDWGVGGGDDLDSAVDDAAAAEAGVGEEWDGAGGVEAFAVEGVEGVGAVGVVHADHDAVLVVAAGEFGGPVADVGDVGGGDEVGA